MHAVHSFSSALSSSELYLVNPFADKEFSVLCNPEIMHTASSDTVPKALSTLKALRQYTCFLPELWVLRILAHMSVPYVNTEMTTDVSKVFLFHFGFPTLGISIDNAVLTTGPHAA